MSALTTALVRSAAVLGLQVATAGAGTALAGRVAVEMWRRGRGER